MRLLMSHSINTCMESDDRKEAKPLEVIMAEKGLPAQASDAILRAMSDANAEMLKNGSRGSAADAAGNDIAYSEPSDYIPKEVRKKLGLGEFNDDTEGRE